MDIKKEFEKLKTVSQVGKEKSYDMIEKFCQNYFSQIGRFNTKENQMFFENVLKVYSYYSFDRKEILKILDDEVLEKVKDDELKSYFENMDLATKQSIIYFALPLIDFEN